MDHYLRSRYKIILLVTFVYDRIGSENFGIKVEVTKLFYQGGYMIYLDNQLDAVIF